MKELFEFSYRTNVESFSYKGKTIFVYQDHRTILNAIFFAFKNGILKQAPNVFYFDYHDDACDPSKEIKSIASSFDLAKTSEEDFNTIVEYKLRVLDDDWLKAGMEFGLIKDSVVIGAEERHNIESENPTIYTDVSGNEHRLFNLSHFKFELGSRGSLGDTVKRKHFEEVRKLFQFNEKGDYRFSDPSESFILDFDLDCFSGDFKNKTMAWPESIFEKEINSTTGYKHYPIHYFLDQLIDRAEFITICTEPGCCGGYGESFKILSYLDKYLFDGNLGTDTVF